MAKNTAHAQHHGIHSDEDSVNFLQRFFIIPAMDLDTILKTGLSHN